MLKLSEAYVVWNTGYEDVSNDGTGGTYYGVM